ncbi:MAG: SatD family protein [Eggerthellaceae bacterium]|nr:SatD family protein [Eggerthellaceae bacterium]
MDYSALIIDVVRSREYLNYDLASNSNKRQEIQDFLTYCIKFLNNNFSNTIESCLTFSGGDEIQGLFSDPGSAYLCFRLLTMLVHPVKIRGGIGIGTWNIKTNEITSASQDGIAYFNARQSITDAKKSKTSLLVYCDHDYEKTRPINATIDISIQICTQRSEIQNGVALLGEMFLPLFWKNRSSSYCQENAYSFDPNTSGSSYENTCINVLKKKDSYNSRIMGKKEEENPISFIKDYSKLSDLSQTIRKYESKMGGRNLPQYYIDEGVIPGFSYDLENVLGKTRQGLEKTIKNAQITIERNLALSILELFTLGFDAPRWQSWY